MVNNKYAYVDEMCSKCGGHAEIIIPNTIKLCKKCYAKMMHNDS